MNTFLRMLLMGLVLGVSNLSAAQGVGARGAAQGEEDEVPAPPEEDQAVEVPVVIELPGGDEDDAPSLRQEDTPSPEAADPGFFVPPSIAHEESYVNDLDELEMVRVAQDRANADREAQEELVRAEAQAELRRVREEREASDRFHRQREEASNERERELVEIITRNEERNSTQPEHATPTTIVVDEGSDLLEQLESFVEPFGSDRSTGGLLALLLGILLALALAAGVRRIRDGLAPSGILPVVFAVLHLAARLLVVALIVAFVVRFLPPRMSLVLLLVFAGAALAVGWSARDLLPDLIAGIILAFERRVRRGMWLSSKEFSGQVERVGLRSSTLRDAQGNELSVPNRFILGAPIATDSTREREQDVTLRLTGYSAAALREAIIDAVLGSPWVAPRHRPLVYRDPDEPELWRVRARLLEARYGVRFEGELLERTEAVLDAIIARDTAIEADLASEAAPGDKDEESP